MDVGGAAGPLPPSAVYGMPTLDGLSGTRGATDLPKRTADMLFPARRRGGIRTRMRHVASVDSDGRDDRIGRDDDDDDRDGGDDRRDGVAADRPTGGGPRGTDRDRSLSGSDGGERIRGGVRHPLLPSATTYDSEDSDASPRSPRRSDTIPSSGSSCSSDDGGSARDPNERDSAYPMRWDDDDYDYDDYDDHGGDRCYDDDGDRRDHDDDYEDRDDQHDRRGYGGDCCDDDPDDRRTDAPARTAGRFARRRHAHRAGVGDGAGVPERDAGYRGRRRTRGGHGSDGDEGGGGDGREGCGRDRAEDGPAGGIRVPPASAADPRRGPREQNFARPPGERDAATLAETEEGSREGISLPLYFDGRCYELAACVAGTPLPLAVSTVRRTLSVSAPEASARRMCFRDEELVRPIRRKACAMYCAEATLFLTRGASPAGGPSAEAVRISRCDVFLCAGSFRSRIGLLSSDADRRALPSLLRIDGADPSRFGLLLRGLRPVLALADDASRAVPAGVRRIPLHRVSFATAKGCIALPLRSIRVGPARPAGAAMRRRGIDGADDGRPPTGDATRLRWVNPIPAIVHAELPELLLPEDVASEVLARIRRASGAFASGCRHDFPDMVALRSALACMPSVRLFFDAEPDRGDDVVAPRAVQMRVRAWQYVRAKERPDGGWRVKLLIGSVVAPFQCCVLGNCALDDRCSVFSRAERSAWVW